MYESTDSKAVVPEAIKAVHSKNIVEVLFTKISHLTGAKPSSRAHASINCINGINYMFGGQSQSLFNDIYAIDCHKWECTQI